MAIEMAELNQALLMLTVIGTGPIIGGNRNSLILKSSPAVQFKMTQHGADLGRLTS